MLFWFTEEGEGRPRGAGGSPRSHFPTRGPDGVGEGESWGLGSEAQVGGGLGESDTRRGGLGECFRRVVVSRPSRRGATLLEPTPGS